MVKPHVHAQSSARKYGEVPEDYLEIHQFLDASKVVFADNRHRALTHNSGFIAIVLPRVFDDHVRVTVSRDYIITEPYNHE